MNWFGRIFKKLNTSSDNCIFKELNKPISGNYFIEFLGCTGQLSDNYVRARKIVYRDGQFYLYGWRQMFPTYQVLPVDRILTIADEVSGELVPREDVLRWLWRRAMR